jgi:hypothetical protein
MAKKKKYNKTTNEAEVAGQVVADDQAGDESELAGEGPSAVDDGSAGMPVMPDVPPPQPDMPPPPPPPPPRTPRPFDLPPLKIGGDDSKSAGSSKSVLQGILERTRTEVETETVALMDSLKVQQDSQKLAREEEERQKAVEARARVEEERRKRDASMREYEERQKRKEEAERGADAAVIAPVHVEEPKKSSKGGIIAAVVVVVLAIGAGIFWYVTPKAEPVVFNVDTSIARARPGMVLAAPVNWGPSSLRTAKVVDPVRLVGVVVPERYVEAPKPVAAKKVAAKAVAPKKLINVRTGILGGKKVVR